MTDINIDIDNIVTDLNGKADRDLTNAVGALSSSAKEYFTKISLPSSKYVDLTLGASGATYIAPADGYFQFTKRASGAVQSISLWNSTISSFGIRTSVPSGENAACFLPIRKGDICSVTYSTSGETITFRFYYTQGEI